MHNYTNLVFQVKGAEGSSLVAIASQAADFCNQYGVCMDLDVDRANVRVTPGETTKDVMLDIEEQAKEGKRDGN